MNHQLCESWGEFPEKIEQDRQREPSLQIETPKVVRGSVLASFELGSSPISNPAEESGLLHEPVGNGIHL